MQIGKIDEFVFDLLAIKEFAESHQTNGHSDENFSLTLAVLNWQELFELFGNRSKAFVAARNHSVNSNTLA